MHRVLVIVVSLGLIGVLAACGADSASPEPTSTETPTASEPTEETEAPPEPAGPRPVRIEVTISGDDVSPSGERVRAEVGQPIVFVIHADEPGELHVHTSPDQEIAYGPGRSRHELVVERPGVVEVESHDTHRVIVQLEVR